MGGKDKNYPHSVSTKNVFKNGIPCIHEEYRENPKPKNHFMSTSPDCSVSNLDYS